MSTVQIVALITASLFLIQVLYFTSKNKLQDRQAFIWLIFATVGMLIAIFINKINELAASWGIAYMPSLVFLIAFLTILNLLIVHTISLSKQKERLKNLTQEFAYMTKELRDIQKNVHGE